MEYMDENVHRYGIREGKRERIVVEITLFCNGFKLWSSVRDPNYGILLRDPNYGILLGIRLLHIKRLLV